MNAIVIEHVPVRCALVTHMSGIQRRHDRPEASEAGTRRRGPLDGQASVELSKPG